MKQITRKEAKSAGLTRYFTGEMCCNGHVAERRTANFQCTECRPAQVKRQRTGSRTWFELRKRNRVLHAEAIKTKKRRELLRSYGLTVEQYEAMSEAQGHCCAMCRKSETERQKLAVDHCHETGAIRALLCGLCNRNLGTYERRKAEFEVYLTRYTRWSGTGGLSKTFPHAGVTSLLC